MPILPENRHLYPKNWKEISLSVRKNAGNKCEFCGAENHKLNPLTKSIVVLTVAHLDHNPQNNKKENLKSACQRCHNIYDIEHRQHTKKNKVFFKTHIRSRGSFPHIFKFSKKVFKFGNSKLKGVIL